jgi:hypothetical protein
MLSSRLTRCARNAFAVTAAVLILGQGMPAGFAHAVAAATATAPAARMRVISYRGYRFTVPAAWPVFNLARQSRTCVRFDLHAVYLGTPGADQSCPSWLVGATETIVIQPGSRAAGRVSVENAVADQITAIAPGITVTATFYADPTAIYRILASAGLAAPTIVVPDPVAGGAAAGGAAAGHPAAASPGRAAARSGSGSRSGAAARELAVSAGQLAASAAVFGRIGEPALPATVANAVGLGFDVCAAPSSGVMRAWKRHSPYSSVGIYIGGSDRACDQQNLTQAWVRQQAADGWRFIPMYAGPQASFGQLKSPVSQGTAAARDAVQQAERLGFGPRTPLYYDMEAYASGDSGAALRFLSAWTIELHRLGYQSGVYSSSDSAIIDLSRQYRSRAYAMPDVVYDALWNGSRDTSDRVYRPGQWTGGRRLHQFSGDVIQTFGGYTMEIDQDYLDVTLAAPGGTTQASPGASGGAGSVAAFYERSGHRLWSVSGSPAGRWTHADLGGYLTSPPTVVQVGTGELDVFYRGRGNILWQRTRTSSGWHQPHELRQMGAVGVPRAVAQPNGVIDVFWAGTHDDHLWHGQYSPGRGWTGPQNLGGSLSGSPYPVETAAGQVQVFWQGKDTHLWHVVRRLGAPWSGAASLGMGRLGGAPHAVALANGQIDVFWRGSTAPHVIWSAELSPGHRAAGPMRRGGVITGQPWPVVGAGTERVLFRGRDGRLWTLGRSGLGRWGGPLRITQSGVLASPPFAAAGPAGSSLQVFWTGPKRQLWSGRLTAPGSWHRPVDLGSI